MSSDATRYAPALRLAQSLLSRSTLPRKEAVLISDFQKTGWERQEEISLPDGAVLTPISVAAVETANLGRDLREVPAHVVLRRRARDGHGRRDEPQHVHGQGPAGQARRSTGGWSIHANVSVEPNATASVTFPAMTVADQMRATVRAGTDALPPTTSSTSCCRRAGPFRSC